MNAANSLTIIRLMLAPVLGWSITHGHWWLAAFTMAGAIASDVFDGKLARSHGTASSFGGFFDHATDAIFVSTGAWALAAVGLINPWLWPLIGIAFLQYTLDSNSLRGHELRTSKLGRYNGVGYYALVSTAIGYQALLSTSLLGPARTAHSARARGRLANALSGQQHGYCWSARSSQWSTVYGISSYAAGTRTSCFWRWRDQKAQHWLSAEKPRLSPR